MDGLGPHGANPAHFLQDLLRRATELQGPPQAKGFGLVRVSLKSPRLPRQLLIFLYADEGRAPSPMLSDRDCRSSPADSGNQAAKPLSRLTNAEPLLYHKTLSRNLYKIFVTFYCRHVKKSDRAGKTREGEIIQ